MCVLPEYNSLTSLWQPDSHTAKITADYVTVCYGEVPVYENTTRFIVFLKKSNYECKGHICYHILVLYFKYRSFSTRGLILSLECTSSCGKIVEHRSRGRLSVTSSNSKIHSKMFIYRLQLVHLAIRSPGTIVTFCSQETLEQTGNIAAAIAQNIFRQIYKSTSEWRGFESRWFYQSGI